MTEETINFDFHLNPGLDKDTDNPLYHARITNSKIIDVKDIAGRLTRESTLSNVDLAAVLMGIRQVIIDELANGNVVNLDGIGKFEPILGMRCGECTGNEQGKELTLKTVKFRVHKSLVDDIRTIFKPCLRQKTKHSAEMTENELYIQLTDYFKTHDTLTRKILEEKYQLTRYKATKFINMFVSEGRLSHPGNSNDSQYKPVPGYFGTPGDTQQQ